MLVILTFICCSPSRSIERKINTFHRSAPTTMWRRLASVPGNTTRCKTIADCVCVCTANAAPRCIIILWIMNFVYNSINMNVISIEFGRISTHLYRRNEEAFICVWWWLEHAGKLNAISMGITVHHVTSDTKKLENAKSMSILIKNNYLHSVGWLRCSRFIPRFFCCRCTQPFRLIFFLTMASIWIELNMHHFV